jgi:hypothetical protein
MTDVKKKFAIMRIGKIVGRKSVRDALKHNHRELKNDKSNIDPTRTHLNQAGKNFGTYAKCKDKFEKNMSTVKVQTDAVMLHELVVTMSPEQTENMSAKQIEDYFVEAVNWGVKMHGGINNLVSWHIHHDEKTPHVHALFTPIVKDDKGKLKLASRRLLGNIEVRRKPTEQELKQNSQDIESAIRDKSRKIPKALVANKNNVFVITRSAQRMSDYQTDFFENVGKKHGLDRGIKKSITNAKHTPIKQYYEQLAREVDKLEIKLQAQTNKISENSSKMSKNSITISAQTNKISENSITISAQKEHIRVNQGKLDELTMLIGKNAHKLSKELSEPLIVIASALSQIRENMSEQKIKLIKDAIVRFDDAKSNSPVPISEPLNTEIDKQLNTFRRN